MAKKFIASEPTYLLQTFTSKAHSNLQGVFPPRLALSHLATFLQLFRDDAKRWPRVTTPIMVGKTPCKLLCAFEVKVCNKYVGSLAINFLALADIKALSL